MPAREVDTELPFPLGGVHAQFEFEEQPPETTPIGENVRGTEGQTLRRRGGSRPGLLKYIPQQLPPGLHEVQMLSMIVDPSSPAFRQQFLVPGTDWVEDPLNPGQFVPLGGWGNPGGSEPANQDDPSAALAFVQSTIAGFDTITGEQTISYATTPGGGRFLLAIVATFDGAVGSATTTVKNGALNAYTQIGTYKRFTKTGVEFSLSLWWKKAEDGASEISLKVTPSAEVNLVVAGMEFSGASLTPIGDTANNSGNNATMTTGAMTAISGDCVIGAFLAGLSPDTVTPTVGFTLQINHDDGTVDTTDIQLYVAYKLNQAAGAINPAATLAGGADDFAALGLCIKD